MARETISNARIVTPDDVVLGTVEICDGVIETVDEGNARSGLAIDFEGDYLLPGLVELHTDNLEKHFAPRPGVNWPGQAAVLAHDSQLAAAGITTVFDAISVGDIHESEVRLEHLSTMTEAVKAASGWDVFRADHFLHMRCEVSYADVMDLFRPFADEPLVRLVSLMDHTPGQRQFVNLDKHRQYYQNKFGLSDAEMADYVESKQQAHRTYSARHRTQILEALNGKNVTLASHDDATPEHIDEAVRDGMAIAEFPTTVDAARARPREGYDHSHGSAKSGARRLAFRQRLGARARLHRATGCPVVRLRAVEHPARHLPSEQGGAGDDVAAGRGSRDGESGQRCGSRGPRRDRARQTGGFHPHSGD